MIKPSEHDSPVLLRFNECLIGSTNGGRQALTLHANIETGHSGETATDRYTAAGIRCCKKNNIKNMCACQMTSRLSKLI